MGEFVDLFEDLRERNNEKGYGSFVEFVELVEFVVFLVFFVYDYVDLEVFLLGDLS